MAVDVPLGVIHHVILHVLGVKPTVGKQRTGVYLGTRLDVLPNLRLK